MSRLRIVVAALALAAPWPAQARGKAKTLDDFLPRRLGGAELQRADADIEDQATGSYKLGGAASAGARTVTLVLTLAPYESATALTVKKPGQKVDGDAGTYEGLTVAGRFVERWCAASGGTCHVTALFAKQAMVTLSVEPVLDRGEPLRLLREVDLAGLGAYARKHAPAAAKRKSPERHLARANELFDLLKDEKPQTIGEQLPDRLTQPQIVRLLDARSSIGGCYDTAVVRTPSLSRGDVTVSFTVQPDGRATDVRVESSTIADVTVGECVVAEIRRASFPRALKSTNVKHTFAFPIGSTR